VDVVQSMHKCTLFFVVGVDGRYHRGPASDYDRWAKITNDPTWSYDSLLPLFRKSEHFQDDPPADTEYITPSPSAQYHGREGEWKVGYGAYFHKISSFFIRAAESLGVPFNADFNAESTLGVGRIQTFVDAKDRARSSAEKAFLGADVRARENLTVLTGAQCQSVIIENGKCVGAIVQFKDREIRLRASKQVIVSCGAFDSPRILHASVIPLPGIGKNLQDHLGINVSFRIPPTFDPSIKTIDSNNGMFSQYYLLFQWLWQHAGPAASNLGEAVAFYRTSAQNVLKADNSSGPEAPHVEIIQVPLLTHHHEGQSTLGRRHRPDFDWARFEYTGRYVTIIPLLLTPFSRGEVRMREGGMDIDPHYLEDERDLEVLVEGVRWVRKLVKEGYPAAGLEGMEEMMPGGHVTTEEGLKSFVRDHSETYYHPVGTCKVLPPVFGSVLMGRWG
jgi:choline dehydrogenase